MKKVSIFAPAIRVYLMRRTGEMAERSNAAVLKTVDCNRSGGSNPSFSADKVVNRHFKSQNPLNTAFKGFFIFGIYSKYTLYIKVQLPYRLPSIFSKN